ncbi:MAG: lipid A deacylase LpxR family protein [Phycisphaerae bacterium]|nr:lipid A deacylase LpxR family protein [Phycisphaerae bacterium]
MASKGFDKKCKWVFIFIYLLVFGAYGFAKDAISVYVENDSRMLKPFHKTDRHYTHGTKLVYLTRPDWEWLGDFTNWRAAEPGEDVETAVGYFLGQNIYTPDHPDNPPKRNPEDMVFAGWLYTGIFAQRATNHILEHFEFNVGVIGPSSKAEQVQSCIHSILNSNESIGWDDQLADELAVDVSYMRKQRLLGGWFEPTEKTDVIAEYGFTAGSVHRHVQAGVTFRYGFNLGNTFGPGRLSLPAGISALRASDAKSGYLFARAGAKAVEYNRFLTGLDTEPLVGEFQVGAVYQCNKLELGYSQTFFTREFGEQSGKDSIGAITITYRF